MLKVLSIINSSNYRKYTILTDLKSAIKIDSLNSDYYIVSSKRERLGAPFISLSVGTIEW